MSSSRIVPEALGTDVIPAILLVADRATLRHLHSPPTAPSVASVLIGCAVSVISVF